MYMYTCVYMHIYIYIYTCSIRTVGFHNLNLRIFDLRVSNPSKPIVDVCLTRCTTYACMLVKVEHHKCMYAYMYAR